MPTDTRWVHVERIAGSVDHPSELLQAVTCAGVEKPPGIRACRILMLKPAARDGLASAPLTSSTSMVWPWLWKWRPTSCPPSLTFA